MKIDEKQLDKISVEHCHKCGGTGYADLPGHGYPGKAQPKCNKCNGTGHIILER